MSFENHIDNSPQAVGTCGPTASSGILLDRDANFDAYLITGLVCYNTTKDTHGLITAITQTTITATDVLWTSGDAYEIYKTATKNSSISSTTIDDMYGRKVLREYELNLDEDIPGNQFAPGQPGGHHG